MLHDLSLVWTPSTTPTELANTLAMSAELGYNVVALDHMYQGAMPSTISSPLGQAITDATSCALTTSSRRIPRILHRATVVISDLTVNHRLSAVAAVYDLVAVRPTTEKAFQAACLNMAEPALISLDLTSYFSFYFKHRACMAAVRRGVHFEVCYGQALRAGDSSTAADVKSGGAARARALFVANLAGLVRATRGRGIVVSSGARAALDLRGPADVVNLLAVWGLAPDRGTEGIAALPRSIVANESLRRRGFRGVVDIVQTAGSVEAKKQQSTTGDAKQQKSKQQQQQQKSGDHRKRKADDGLGGGPQAKHQQMKKQKKV
ncbi:RNA-binding RNA processing protein rpp1 [Sporothrix epigloea]|uniref:RNA-binding RNA processing protein rpp1 n=1 Tax=Sporothrix epigloea TaxID=1892477 RepID=A0ABP0DZ40_9PEZI